MRDPEQRLDPPEMSRRQEDSLEEATRLVSKIEKLHSKVEDHFDELTVAQIEDILGDAQAYLDELGNLADEDEGVYVEDEYSTGSWMVEEIEGWFNEKLDAIKVNGDE